MKLGRSVTQACLTFCCVMNEVPWTMPMSPITFLLLQVGGLGHQYFDMAMLNLLSPNEAMTSRLMLLAAIFSRRARLLPVACLRKRPVQLNSYFLRVIHTLKHYCDIVSDIPSGSIYGIYISTLYLTFFLADTLTFYPAFDLASILTNWNIF